MEKYTKLSDYISFNMNFKTSINLYLNLNKHEKIKSYIPTKSSLIIMRDYLKSVLKNTEQASLLIGPYGKGKSHLFLVVLALLSMPRNEENYAIITYLQSIIDDGSDIGKEVRDLIGGIWDESPMLPVLIQDIEGDLRQSFLYALNEALKRNGLEEIFPDTYFSYAIKRIDEWDKEFPDTYQSFISELESRNLNIGDFKVELSAFSREALDIFMDIYPVITSGSSFNPMVNEDVLPIYKSISDKLKEYHGYSGLYIVFDEFSKFLESQEENKVGSNMKFLQDICELSCDSSDSKVYITMIAHKSIKEYGKYIPREIINAFTGIEGRLVEKYFITSSKNNYELIKDAIVKDDKKEDLIPNADMYFGDKICDLFYAVPFFKSNFNRDDFKQIILEGCYPLNPIGSYLLLNISEKVAQNERTLFTFISNDEPNSMFRFINNHNGELPWIVSVECIYDYFSNLFKKEVVNELVHNEWLNAEYAISKCVNDEQRTLIKTLALFLIVDKFDELPATDKLLSLASGLSDAMEIISELEQQDIIYRKGATNSFVFKTRAGASLKNEIKRQRALRGDSIDYNKVFSVVEQKKFILPQRYNTNVSMTRYFRYEYMQVDDFLTIEQEESFFDDNEFCDGKVIALFSLKKIDQEKVKKHYKKLNSRRIVVVCPKSVFKGTKQALDLEIVLALNNSRFTNDNEVLTRELPVLEEDLIRELRQKLDKMYISEDCLILYLTMKGQLCRKNPKSIDEAVNLSCEFLYKKTPEINNEMVNRHKINTAQTKKTRNNIIEAVLYHKDVEDFYSGTNQEATVYRSLFINTGLKQHKESENFKEVMSKIERFIDRSSGRRTKFTEIVGLLTAAPYGVRLGVIPLLFSWVLSQRKEDVVMYFNDKEVQINADIIVNAIDNPCDYELFVSREDLEKEKYIAELNSLFEIKNELNLGDNRIKNISVCIQRWFRALPQVTRNFSDTEGLDYSREEIDSARSFKNLIQKLDVNPFELVFIQIPEVFNCVDNYEEAFSCLDRAKTLLDDYYDWIVKKAVLGTYNVFLHNKKDDLYHILKHWYDDQSDDSKRDLLDGKATNFMSFINTLNVYNDSEIVIRLVKVVTDVYIDNWNINAYEDYISALIECKNSIESICDGASKGKITLSFKNRSGDSIEKNFEWSQSSDGIVLKNIIEEALDEFVDLSVNDRVCILLEMIDKIVN